MSNVAAKKPRRSSWTLLVNDLRVWISTHKFAIVASGLFVIANIVRWIWRAVRHITNAASGPSFSLVQWMAAPHPHGPGHTALSARDAPLLQFLHLLESVFFVRGPISLLIFAALLLGGAGFAQTRFGWPKTLAMLVVNTAAGTALGLLACIIINRPFADWPRLQQIAVSLSPFTMVAGTLMAASAFVSVLWRRRIVLLCYAIVGSGLLFTGNPGDYCTLAVVALGHVTGIVLNRLDYRRRRKGLAQPAAQPIQPLSAQVSSPISQASPRSSLPLQLSTRMDEIHAQWWRGTDYEMHRLLAAIQLVLAIGPILAITSRTHAGILTSLGLLITNDFDNAVLVQACERNNSIGSCLVLAGVHHAALAALWIRVLLPVAALAAVAWGLYRGRRLAAWASMLFNTSTAVIAITDYLLYPLAADLADKPLEHHYALAPVFVITALPPLLLTAAIACNLQHFPIRTGTRRIVRGCAAIALSGFAAGSLYLLVGIARPQDFVPRARFSTLLLDIVHRLLPVGFAGRIASGLQPRTLPLLVLAQMLVAGFWLVVLAVFLLWFRDAPGSAGHGRQAAGQLVERNGESMSFMTTWEDNRYWFSASTRSAVAYRVLHGVALTVTGPFGDPREYGSSLREFIRFCNHNSWTPAFYAVHEPMREQLERLGCLCINVGTEMVVIPSRWQTRGKKWQDIRTAINKAKRDGVADVLTTFEDAGWEIQQQIVDISEQWAQLKALPEMKFTLGGVEELRDSRVALLYALDAQGVVLGVTSWMPTYRDGRVIGWTLDFMRHRTDSPNGIMEFLIARMAERLRDEGMADPEHAVEFMSLSAAPLAGMGEGGSPQGTADAEVIEHALQIVADMLEPAYGFRSLFFFKRKFQPVEAPIYLCYPDPVKLPQIGLAVVSAYVPGLKPSQIAGMLKAMRGQNSKS
jgi:lysylphosphatidylglycerol synthetase-like protein (DUF2156 family)